MGAREESVKGEARPGVRHRGPEARTRRDETRPNEITGAETTASRRQVHGDCQAAS